MELQVPSKSNTASGHKKLKFLVDGTSGSVKFKIRLQAVKINWNYRFRRDGFRSSLYWNNRFHKSQKIKDKNKMKRMILLQ